MGQEVSKLDAPTSSKNRQRRKIRTSKILSRSGDCVAGDCSDLENDEGKRDTDQEGGGRGIKKVVEEEEVMKKKRKGKRKGKGRNSSGKKRKNRVKRKKKKMERRKKRRMLKTNMLHLLHLYRSGQNK
uniref:Wssv060 n=1 Tax=White spot syndrome virus TaxID=342409 RepID=A0A3G5BHF5_9VIRU|nr:wssv060 [White spot syndrome virus]